MWNDVLIIPVRYGLFVDKSCRDYERTVMSSLLGKKISVIQVVFFFFDKALAIVGSTYYQGYEGRRITDQYFMIHDIP